MLDGAGLITSGELLLVGLLISLILVSIVGNCLVCVAIFTDRRLRKLGNAFIVSLAIADLFVSCLVMTFALCNDLMNYWIFGDWFCDVWISFDIMCCTASILNLCAISLDRFIHIKDCLLYNQWMTRRVAISAVIVIWFISALVSFVPINLGWHKPDYKFGGGQTGGLVSTTTIFGSSQPLDGAPHFRPARLVFAGDADQQQQQQQLATNSGFVWPLGRQSDDGTSSKHHLVLAESLQAKLDYYSETARDGIENQSSTEQQQRQHQQMHRRLNTRKAGGESHRKAAEWKDEHRASKALRMALANRQTSTSAATTKQDEGNAIGHFDLGSLGADGRKSFLLSRRQASDGSSSGHQVVSDGETAPPLRRQAAAASSQFNQVESNPQDGSQIGKLNPLPSANDAAVSSQRQRRQLAAGDGGVESRKNAHNGWPPSMPASLPMQTLADAQQLDYYYQSGGGGGGGDLTKRAPETPDEPAKVSETQQTSGASSTSPSHAQCMLTLTPTYAIISSTISFYIPCIIMLGLYTKLFACARRHVRNIQAISKAPAPIAISPSINNQPIAATTAFANSAQHSSREPEVSSRAPPLRTWLKLKPKLNAPNAQTENDKSITAKREHMPDNNNNNHNKKPHSQQRTTTSSSQTDSKLLSNKAIVHANQTTTVSIGQSVELKAAITTTTTSDTINKRNANDQLPTTDKAQEDGLRRRQQTDQIGLNDEVSDETVTSLATLKAEAADKNDMIVPIIADQRLIDDTPSSQQHLPPQQDLNQATERGQPEERTPFLVNSPSGLVQLAVGRPKSCLTVANQSRQQPKVNFQAPNQQQSGQLATHKAAVTLGIIMGTFLFCWVPFFCLNIIKAFCVDCIPSSVFRAFTWLGYANSALNPIIYGIHNSEFRNAFNRIFFKHLNIKNSRYYMNRRFSYDQRHPTHRKQQLQQNSHGSSGNHLQQLKSNAVT